MTGCRVEVCPDPFDPWQQLALWSGAAAAAAIFIGRVRPTTMDGRPLEALELEHFPGLCERQITPITPALRSASIAICLPGNASRVKRAITSEVRPAPLVTTMKLMIIKMIKIMKPTM